MRRWLLLLVVILAACGGPAPVSRADLEAALYQDGDAPSEWRPGQISDAVSVRAGMAEAELVVSRSFSVEGGNRGGEVAVLLYADAATAQEFYPLVRPGAIGGGRAEVGDEGTESGQLVVWRRCRAVAILASPGNPNTRVPLLAYARRLDERLTALAC